VTIKPPLAAYDDKTLPPEALLAALTATFRPRLILADSPRGLIRRMLWQADPPGK